MTTEQKPNTIELSQLIGEYVLVAVQSQLAIDSFPALGPVRVRVERRRQINKRGKPPVMVVGPPKSPIHFRVHPAQINDDDSGCWVGGVLTHLLKEPGRMYGWRLIGRVNIDCAQTNRQLDLPQTCLVGV